VTLDTVPFTGVSRPQRADARRNFDALLAAAREAFAEKGPGASLEDIARRADVGIGTLYRNFPTRDELIETVYVAEVERLIEDSRAGADLEPWASFLHWVDAFLVYIGTKRALIEGLNRESSVLQGCRVGMYSSIAPILARAQAAGVIRDDVTVEDVARLISGIAGVAFPDDAQRDRVLGVALDGLRAR
jgi:AcrR family transcriptional regulator